MSVAFDHRDPGTSEDDWRAAAPWQDAAPLILDVERVIVLAAHPDDETLGAGGLIATATAAGIPVDVVIATDGEGSHPHADLRLRRRLEVTVALADLAPTATLSFLGLPDGGLREHVDETRRRVQTLLAGIEERTVLLVAPWWADGHRDHRVLGEVARDLGSGRVRVVGYPIWFWHWAEPADTDRSGWRSLALSPDARVAKQRATGRHVTQVTAYGDGPPVLHGGMLQHFSRRFEIFVEASGSSAENSATPEFFERFHRRHADPWGLDGRWYETRKREVLLAALPKRSARKALEIGCATGALTTLLRDRAEDLLAVDVSQTALAKAADRIGDDPRVELRLAHLPQEWPGGDFDLIVLSEVGYFWSHADLSKAVNHIVAALPENGVLIACHWRHAFDDAPLDGDQVHALIAARPELEQTVRHVERDFLLDVFVRRPGAPS